LHYVSHGTTIYVKEPLSPHRCVSTGFKVCVSTLHCANLCSRSLLRSLPRPKEVEIAPPPSAGPSTNRRTRAAHVRWYGRAMALYHDRHGSLLPRFLAKDAIHTDPRRVLARAHPR